MARMLRARRDMAVAFLAQNPADQRFIAGDIKLFFDDLSQINPPPADQFKPVIARTGLDKADKIAAFSRPELGRPARARAVK